MNGRWTLGLLLGAVLGAPPTGGVELTLEQAMAQARGQAREGIVSVFVRRVRGNDRAGVIDTDQAGAQAEQGARHVAGAAAEVQHRGARRDGGKLQQLLLNSSLSRRHAHHGIVKTRQCAKA